MTTFLVHYTVTEKKTATVDTATEEAAKVAALASEVGPGDDAVLQAFVDQRDVEIEGVREL